MKDLSQLESNLIKFNAKKFALEGELLLRLENPGNTANDSATVLANILQVSNDAMYVRLKLWDEYARADRNRKLRRVLTAAIITVIVVLYVLLSEFVSFPI